jgi:hypothetical protein
MIRWLNKELPSDEDVIERKDRFGKEDDVGVKNSASSSSI